MIIAIEGADGCGKTSVAAALGVRLQCPVIAFPNDEAYTGPAIRSYLRKEWAVDRNYDTETGEPVIEEDSRLSALAFQSLQVANRMELMPMLADAKRNCRNLVLARYWQSAYVYGALDGLDKTWLFQVHAEMVAPHLNVLLSVPPSVCLARRAQRQNEPLDRYEGRLEFTAKVVNGYEELWAQQAADPRWAHIDATQPFAAVVDSIINRLPVV